ncbi:MAG: phage tail protein [Anaerolineae bacterium]|nr:phage tail protein [Anaerolineae bacterium]
MANRDPLAVFHYGVEVQGEVTGYFTECSGIGSENELIEHKVVDEKGRESIHKIPGRLKWQDITLKRGITNNMDIWDWREQIVDGKVDDARRNGSIIMYNQALEEVARWNFENGWPLKVSGPSMKADSNEFGIEELVITHEGLYREK